MATPRTTNDLQSIGWSCEASIHEIVSDTSKGAWAVVGLIGVTDDREGAQSPQTVPNWETVEAIVELSPAGELLDLEDTSANPEVIEQGDQDSKVVQPFAQHEAG
jgi:hypothetical protein